MHKYSIALLSLLLAACAQTPTENSAASSGNSTHQGSAQSIDDPALADQPIVQMTVVASTLDAWPYRGKVSFAIPDDHLYGKAQGRPWLPLIKEATIARLQALGLEQASPEIADVIVSIGVLGEKEDADAIVFAKLGMSPGAGPLSKGTMALLIQDRQSQIKLWSSALQANSSMPIKATAARERTVRSFVDQMTRRLPPAN